MFILASAAVSAIAAADSAVVVTAANDPAWTNRAPFCLWSSPAAAEWTLPGASGAFDLRVRGIDVKPVGRGVILCLPDQAAPPAAGGPDVPVLARTVPCPAGMSVTVEVVRAEYQDFGPVQVEPAISVIREFRGEGQEPLRREERRPLPAYYGVAEFWPGPLAVSSEGTFGTQKVARIECRPVQYNPTTGILRCFKQIEGRVRLVPQ